MANFLNRLAARALGVAQVAQPVIPAVFTPGFGLERNESPLDTPVERIAEPSVSSTPSESARQATLPGPGESSHANTALRASLNASLADSFPAQTVPRASLNTSLPDSSPAQHEPGPRVRAERLPVSANAVLITGTAASPTMLNSLAEVQPEAIDSYVPDQVSASSSEPALQQSSGSSRLTAEPMLTQEVPHTRRQAVEAFQFGPATPTNPSTTSARHGHIHSPGPEAPVIRVTIGRIDVRAQFSAPPPPPAAAWHARPATLSLDEYLKQRSEGKR